MNEKAMIERLLSPRTISQHMTWADLFAALELDRKDAAEMLRKVVAERDALRKELDALRRQEPALWIVKTRSGMARTITKHEPDRSFYDMGETFHPLHLAAGAHGAIEKAAQGLIDDIDCLMSESEGVAGLHLNGDLAPWGELEPGGRFERLTHLDLLRDALAAGAQSAPDVRRPIETAPNGQSTETTECWHCNATYGKTAPRCPSCCASNANVDYEAAKEEVDDPSRIAHDWRWVKDWIGDKNVPNGTYDCSRWECTRCGSNDREEPAPKPESE